MIEFSKNWNIIEPSKAVLFILHIYVLLSILQDKPLNLKEKLKQDVPNAGTAETMLNSSKEYMLKICGAQNFQAPQ